MPRTRIVDADANGNKARLEVIGDDGNWRLLREFDSAEDARAAAFLGLF
jgi:hypothetical protein